MYKRIHPYSLIIGLMVGVALLLVLKVPIFALFGGFCGVLISDLFINRGKADTDQDPE